MYHDEFMMYLDLISLQYNLISFYALSIQLFNSSSYKYSSQSYLRVCASTEGVYTARDRWSKHPSIHPSRACFNNRTQLGRAALKLHCCQIDDLWLSLASKCVKSSANLRIVLVKGAGPWVNCGKNETSCICPGHCECSPTHWLKYDGWIYNKFNPWYSMIMKCPHCTGAESQSIAAGKPKGHSSGCVM